MRQYSLKKDYSQRNMSLLKFTGWMCAIFAIVLFTLYVHENIEPPVANAQTGTETKSDHQQEVSYCKAWNKSQTQVSGATNMQIARHCESYL